MLVYSSTAVANATYIEVVAEKGEPFRANMQAVTCRIVSSHSRVCSINEARAVDVVLRLIRAQSRVVRREARTRSCCRVRWCRTEADMFDQRLVGYHHGVQCSGTFALLLVGGIALFVGGCGSKLQAESMSIPTWRYSRQIRQRAGKSRCIATFVSAHHSCEFVQPL